MLTRKILTIPLFIIVFFVLATFSLPSSLHAGPLRCPCFSDREVTNALSISDSVEQYNSGGWMGLMAYYDDASCWRLFVVRPYSNPMFCSDTGGYPTKGGHVRSINQQKSMNQAQYQDCAQILTDHSWIVP